MENNPLLLKICRLFPSSLANSCHIRTLSDVAHHHHHHHHHQPCPNNLSSTSSSSTLNPSPPTHVKRRRNPTSSTTTPMPMASHVSSSSNGGGDGEAQSDPVSGQNSFRRIRKKAGLRSDDGVSTQLYYCSRNRRRRSRRWGLEAAGEESYGWYAVEKRTKDPRGEFRASMVEMIVEKQMVAPEDLQRLLLGFLALNSDSYHGMILQVFSEICETLFANY